MVERLVAAQAKTGCVAGSAIFDSCERAMATSDIRVSDNGSEVHGFRQNPGGHLVCATGIS